MEETQDTTEFSEEENEVNLLNVNKSRNKLKILDSDSDSEIKVTSDSDLNKKSVLKSSSEDEEKNSKSVNESTHKKKRIAVLDSDCEASDDEITPHNKSFPDEETAVEAIIYTTNNKSELIAENSTTVQKSCLSALCDSDTSEDEATDNRVNNSVDEDPVIHSIAYKAPKRRNKDDKPNKMTPQEAAKQRVEIRSESQRMLRESNVSLPYHKPKSYTLKEFLQKRSKLTSASPLIPKAPPSIAIKMCKNQLEEISKKLDERIKQVEEFYKSESEDDEEDAEIVSQDIRTWLDLLVDNAVDRAESKNDELNGETEEKEVESSEQPFSMDYEFNLDDVDERELSKRLNISELLSENVLNIQPKLSGGPDDVIDLDKGITKPNAVKKLVQKFLQHSNKKLPQKHKVHLDIVGIGSGGEIVKETVSMNVDEEEEPAIIETPGAKLQKLREELQNQMAQKRSEFWKQRQEQGECLSTEKKNNDECEKEKDILDDDEEEEIVMTETESEDEEEDDYNLGPEKPRMKSAFIEDEADIDETDDENIDNDEKEDIINDNESEEIDNNGFDGDDEEIPELDAVQNPKKKILRRILKPFTEDSDEEEDEPTQEILIKESTKEALNSTDEDDEIPPNLPRANITPQRPRIDKSELDFLTPVSFLTGLQKLDSASKFLKDSPIISDFERSPSKEQSSLQKKLFSEQSDQSQDSQSNIDDLAEIICSGKFPQTQNCTSEENVSEDVIPSTQDLLNVCSGEFSSIPVGSSNQTQESSDKIVINVQTNPEKEIKSLDEDYSQIISQLLDEDELERFKKKFDSPVASASQRSCDFENVEEAKATGLLNSDDENEGLEIRKKTRQKKLVFSDEEESCDNDDDDEQEDEEQIDLHDTDDEEQLLEKEVEAQESRGYKPSDFLENEAELSESEWGSADEDEKDLDDLEFEQGDEETFNENKLRGELERIHMRQVLDEDNREVKLLQELLLEDGEMHGTGRQRQFRWKALDSLDNSEFEKRDDDDIYLDEEESEEQWRKMRHKREMFLKNKSEPEDVDSILSDSQILKIGQQVFKTSQSFSSQNNTPVDKSQLEEKEPFTLLSKRGSFLTRKDQVLQRLAEYNKVTETMVGTTAKNSRCFVFQTFETAEAAVVKDNNNKRKATDGTPRAIKKLRLNDLSPAINKKDSGKSGRAKKLFKNW